MFPSGGIFKKYDQIPESDPVYVALPESFVGQYNDPEICRVPDLDKVFELCGIEPVPPLRVGMRAVPERWNERYRIIEDNFNAIVQCINEYYCKNADWSFYDPQDIPEPSYPTVPPPAEQPVPFPTTTLPPEWTTTPVPPPVIVPTTTPAPTPTSPLHYGDPYCDPFFLTDPDGALLVGPDGFPITFCREATVPCEHFALTDPEGNLLLTPDGRMISFCFNEVPGCEFYIMTDPEGNPFRTPDGLLMTFCDSNEPPCDFVMLTDPAGDPLLTYQGNAMIMCLEIFDQ